MIRCYVASCKQQSPLFRQNEKGVVGVWACPAHTKPIEDKELLRVVDAIDGKQVTA